MKVTFDIEDGAVVTQGVAVLSSLDSEGGGQLHIVPLSEEDSVTQLGLFEAGAISARKDIERLFEGED